jgi:hypothetical protein
MIRLLVAGVVLTVVLVRTAPSAAEDKEAANVTVKAVLPKDPLPRGAVNSGTAPIKLRFENKGKKEVVLYPLFTLDVQDDKGKPVPPGLALGSGPPDPNLLANLDKSFLVIPAGSAKEIPVSLKHAYNGALIRGWRLPAAGKYRLVFHYTFNRKDFRRTYLRPPFLRDDEARKHAERPERAWDRALDMQRKIEADLTVKD